MIKLTCVYLFKKGFQFPCIEGLLVCHGFFNFAGFSPEEDLNKSTWFFISLTERFFTLTIFVLQLTGYDKKQ